MKLSAGHYAGITAMLLTTMGDHYNFNPWPWFFLWIFAACLIWIAGKLFGWKNKP